MVRTRLTDGFPGLKIFLMTNLVLSGKRVKTMNFGKKIILFNYTVMLDDSSIGREK